MKLVIAFALGIAFLQSPSLVRVDAPITRAHLDSGKLKGRPARLAWSDDESSIYLQVVDGNLSSELKFRHYLVASDGAVKSIDAEPIWAQAYWKWKSAKSFFGDPTMTIDVESQQQVVDALNGTSNDHTPYLSGGRNGISGQTLTLSKQTGGTRVVTRLMLKGKVVGEFVDEQIVPGYTFGWSPEPLGMIAYRSNASKLTIMNAAGETQTIENVKDVLLPAWSEGGQSLACLVRTGTKTFDLLVIPVS